MVESTFKKTFDLNLNFYESWNLCEKQKDYYLWGDKNNNKVTVTRISEHFAEFADKSGFFHDQGFILVYYLLV